MQAKKNQHFHPLEVVSRYRDPQPQVGENDSRGQWIKTFLATEPNNYLHGY